MRIRMPAAKNSPCHKSQQMIPAITTRTAVITFGTLRDSFNSCLGALSDGFDFMGVDTFLSF
jgi:hypothetical protein